MSRALLIILAILSAVLAAVLDLTLLYFVSVALIASAAGLWLFKMKGRFDIGKPDSAGFSPIGQDDLSSFGILEIRPKARNGSAHASRGSGDGAGSTEQTTLFDSIAGIGTEVEVESELDLKSRSATVTVAQVVRKKAPAGRFEAFTEASHRSSSLYQMISVTEERDLNVFGPCLESLASALRANTVALISFDGESHRILGIVSQNAYARGAGTIPTTSAAPFKPPRKGVVNVQASADADWELTDLKYYRGELAVKQVARAFVPVSGEDTTVILLADSVRKGILDTAQAKTLLTQYAVLLAKLLDADTGSGWRPRREIIAEEIDGARTDGQPLALALVLHNRVEELHDSDSLVKAETALFDAMLSSADNVRVEKFGDLMVGVFHRSRVEDVEDWADRVQTELADAKGILRGGVSVGVAIMTERHSTPEQLRAHAAAALQEALESGACTILE